MKLTPGESRFLTALIREQNQTGCRGPAHELLRAKVYPTVPLSGPGSLAYSYEAVPLTSILLQDHSDLQAIDDFLRTGELISEVQWPWSSPEAYRTRLEEARKEWTSRKSQANPLHANGGNPFSSLPPSSQTRTG